MQNLVPRWVKLATVTGFSCLSITACKKEQESGPGEGMYAVSEAQALAAAEHIAISPGVLAQRQHNAQTADTQRVFMGLQRTRSITVLPAADGKPAAYLCNYAKGGYAIIAADRHMAPIMAFAEHGSLPTTDLSNAAVLPLGFLTWLENTKSLAAALRQHPSEKNAEPGAAAAWKKMADAPAPLTEITTQPTPAPGTPTSRLAPDEPTDPPCYSAQYGPLLPTTWDQGWPYNSELFFNGQYCVTGCVATAMAQVMYYWHYPASYQWSAMPTVAYSYNNPYPEMSRLMHNAGDAVDMSYGASSSSAYDYKVASALRNSFQYGSAEYHDYPNGNGDTNTSTIPWSSRGWVEVVDNFRYSRPVIFGGYTDQGSSSGYRWPKGDGHCWVGDGSIEAQCDGYTSLQFHMNWGWNGYCNGWFRFSDWAIRDSNGNIIRNYQYCQDVTLNIHP